MSFLITSCIYQIRNLINGKIYIGSTFDFRYRFSKHKNDLKQNKHDNSYLQASWNKHGEKAFVFEVLEICDKEKLIEREQYWLDKTQCYKRYSGYNICIVSQSPLGIKRSKETRAKMSAWQIGRKMSDEAKKKIGDANRGRKHTKEELEKMRIVSTGRIQTEETKAKRRGRKHTPEALAKMRGLKRSPETRLKMSIAFTGIKRNRKKRQLEI